MIKISDWYTKAGEYSFPTVFIFLTDAEKASLLAGAGTDPGGRSAVAKLQRALASLPRPGFVGADICAPTDSPLFRPGRWVTFAKSAWRLLGGSAKVRDAVAGGRTDCLTVRPFRRMDRTREFRMFIHGRRLVAMSQYWLDRHFPKIVARREEIWLRARSLTETIADRLPAADIVVDCYLCSDNQLLIVDMNAWGGATDPLLFKSWERDWSAEAGLKLIPGPVQMSGNVSVSF